MDISVLNIIAIIYVIWAWYSGWKWISGRVAFLERDGIQYKILKAVIGICVGYVIGAINLMCLVFKFLFNMFGWGK